MVPLQRDCLCFLLFHRISNSGPKRYDYVPNSDDWRYSRDGQELGALMEHELSDTLERKVSLNLGRVSDLA